MLDAKVETSTSLSLIYAVSRRQITVSACVHQVTVFRVHAVADSAKKQQLWARPCTRSPFLERCWSARYQFGSCVPLGG